MKNTYDIGEIVTGCVTGIKDYGIFVSFDKKTSGLVHISEISKKFVSDVSKYVTIGEIIRVQILGLEAIGHYRLSIKNIDYRIMKKRGSKIEETESGFQNLAKALDIWRKEKLEEFKKVQK